MNHIVLFQPEIPPNTGNIARTCAATDTALHLIHPLGFDLSDKHLKRAGLDYWDQLSITHYESLEDFLDKTSHDNYYLITKFAEKTYSDIDYSDTSKDYYFIFGRETSGLPESFMKKYKEKCLRIPMDDQHVRSLNLSNAAAIIIYEALRQQAFEQLDRVTYYKEDKLK
ncbi:tRNA (uridine(34)/cytosine(34)/5-carboxymethylaminomethyluridine(34)-2'-O)-methyltransferase TrmL [Allofustis seminis]|uniref:tRNA (uridine(34)/cytosine(34)/5- carboxymethylaminomethyluridine(34)-2'-O)- methyltransferase TrmL n=1 Tax=Allofustis seminis TaxID=166939 RepID=UPI0003750986|nr:tRNA (uridine(34)/cytosine(34)/5-carboxymethylaminomethyluridine(34)-2'-O)-methyltransferase TrmL [Allofustis seminis]